MVWTDEYKKAIEQAAWLTGVVAISDGMRDEDGIVGLHVDCNVKSDAKRVKKIFLESLISSLGEEQPFIISAYPIRYGFARECSI